MSDETILIVEDEGLTAMGLQRKLKLWGYKAPTFAFSKKEAVKKAREIKPDLILMDIVLKGEGDGIEAATDIKNSLDIPIIYLTAYSDEKTIKRAEITKPTDYILKPYQEIELHNSIETALKKHKFEKKLVESGELLDKKLEGSGGAVIVTNNEGYIRYMNQAAKKITGFKDEKAYSKDLSEVFLIRMINPIGGVTLPNEHNPKIDKKTEPYGSNIVTDIMNEGIINGVTEQAYLTNMEGKDVPIEYTASPIKDDNGEFLGAKLVFTDISERYNAEQSLIESEKWFKNIYYQSSIGIGMYNGEGQIIDANTAALHIFGVEDTSILKDFNLFKDFNLDNKDKENLLEGKTVICEFNFADIQSPKTIKTEAVYLEIIIKPQISSDGKSINYYQVQFHDITKHHALEKSLKQGKDMFKDFLGSIEYPFLVLDSKLNCKYSNLKSENLTGLITEKTIGKAIWELLPDLENPNDLMEAFKNSIKTKKSSTYVYEYRCDDGNGFLELNINPLNDGLTILLKDITKNRTRKNELKSTINILQNEINEKTENFESTKKSLKTELTDINNKNEVLKELTKDLEDRVNETSSKLTKTQGDLKSTTQQHRITEKQLKNTIETLKKELSEKGILLDKTLEKQENELIAYKQIEEDFNEKYQALKTEFADVTKELSLTKTDTESQIKNHIKTEESLIKLKNELEKRLETKSSLLIDLNENLNTEIANRNQIENKFQITKEKLQRQLEEKQAEYHRSTEKMETEIDELKNKINEITELLKQKEELLKNVHTHTKMNIQRISSLTNLQSDYIKEQMVESFNDSQNHINSVSLIHEKLLETPDHERINFSRYLKILVDDLYKSHGADPNKISSDIKADNVFLDIDTATLCGLIITELISNSLKHAFPNGRDGMVGIDMNQDDNSLVMLISDDGIGLSERVNFNEPDTLGLQLVKTLVNEINGQIELKNGNGTEFNIKLNKT